MASLVMFVSVTGCGDDAEPTADGGGAASEASSKAATTSAAPASSEVSTTAFVWAAPSGETLDALIEGSFEVVDSCLGLRNNEELNLVVLPVGSRFDRGARTVDVRGSGVYNLGGESQILGSGGWLSEVSDEMRELWTNAGPLDFQTCDERFDGDVVVFNSVL